jgi:opacity protein-like surface antigen
VWPPRHSYFRLSRRPARSGGEGAAGVPAGLRAVRRGYIGINGGWAWHDKTWVDRDNWIDNFAFDFSEWRWGLAAGFGAEWAWSDRVSIRSEVLYVDFVDRERRVLFAPPATFANFTDSDSMWISRIGINVRLGDPAVAARY